jgi:hypothetical protein
VIKKEVEMGETGSTHGNEERCLNIFTGKPDGKAANLL